MPVPLHIRKSMRFLALPLGCLFLGAGLVVGLFWPETLSPYLLPLFSGYHIDENGAVYVLDPSLPLKVILLVRGIGALLGITGLILIYAWNKQA